MEVGRPQIEVSRTLCGCSEPQSGRKLYGAKLSRMSDLENMSVLSGPDGMKAQVKDLKLIESLFEKMCVIRRFEQTLLALFSKGKLAGTTHTSIGQEAIAVAVGAHLIEGDVVFSSHRCHGHFLAYGGSPQSLAAECMGKAGGVCGGRGGSQHLHHGNFFSSGIQGGIVGNAVGAALAQKMGRLKHSNNLVVAFLGDGTLGEGLVYESFNFAALQMLPILFVLENNRYAQSTPVEIGVSGSMVARAEAFEIEADEIESNDAYALHGLFEERFARVRHKRAPFFQVVHTYRLAPHSEGDDHRNPQEIEKHRKNDPIVVLGRELPEQVRSGIEQKAQSIVLQSVAAAEESPEPIDRPLVSPKSEIFGREQMPIPYASADVHFAHALNGSLHKMLEEQPDVFFMGEDILDPYGGAFKVAKGLSTRFPDKVIPTPISEAGIVAWGVGAALMGLRPIVEIMFGDFLALAADQVLNHAAKYRWISGDEVEVPLVIRTPMGGHRGYGPTHSQSIEKMFFGIPGLTVVSPSHLLDPGELLRRSSLLSKSPVLFIENKLLYSRRLMPVDSGRVTEFYVRGTTDRYPTLHLSLTDFGDADVVLVTYGGNMPVAMDAVKSLLMEHELVADLVVPSLIDPIPLDEIRHFVGATGRIVTLEEASTSSGWGAEVIASLCEQNDLSNRKYMRLGAQHCPVPAAKALESQALPRLEFVVDRIRRFVE